MSSLLNYDKLLKWSNLNHMFTALAAYGGVSCIYPTNSYIVVGTTKGLILIFNYKEFLQYILMPQALNEDDHNLRSKVQLVSLSADGTHLAASYQSGDVFLWDLSMTTTTNGNRTTTGTAIEPINAILHITEHRDIQVNGLEFVGNRHTGLLVSDLDGNITFHNGYRSRLWYLDYTSKKILSIPSNEILLNCKSQLFIKNKDVDNGLTAVLTNTNFAIMQLAKNMAGNIVFQEKITYNSTSRLIPYNDISWYRKPRERIQTISFSINNQVNVIKFQLVNNRWLQLVSKKITYQLLEPIISMNWISDSLLSFFTISNRFLIMNPFQNFEIILSLDLSRSVSLSSNNIVFKLFSNKIFISSSFSFTLGSFQSWSSLILNHVQRGDYINALNLLNTFVTSNSDSRETIHHLATLLNLNPEIDKRKLQLLDPFHNLSLAALKYLLKEDTNNEDDMANLLALTIHIQSSWFPNDKESLLLFLDQQWESILTSNGSRKSVYLETVVELVSNETLKIIPPSIFKSVISHVIDNNEKYDPTKLNSLILHLDPNCWDVDYLCKLMRNLNLQNQMLLCYVWNIKFDDFVTPLVDLLKWIRDGNTSNTEIFHSEEEPDFVFDYIKYLLLGNYYPSNESLLPFSKQAKVKSQLCYIIFNGVCINWPYSTSNRFSATQGEQPSFPYFNLLLHFNAPKFLDVLTAILEDSFFSEEEEENDDYYGEHNSLEIDTEFSLKVTRQYVVDIFLDKLLLSDPQIDKTLISIFLATNIPKYPQFIRVMNTQLECIVSELLRPNVSVESSQLENGLEALLPIYEPKDENKFITELKERNFYGAMYQFHHRNKNFVELLRMTLDYSVVFETYENITLGSTFEIIIKNIMHLDLDAQLEVADIISFNFTKIMHILNPTSTVKYIQKIDPQLHENILKLEDESVMQEYMEELFKSYTNSSTALKDAYISLCCKFKPQSDLIPWLTSLQLEGVSIEKLTSNLQNTSNYEGLSVIYSKLKNYELVVDNLVMCINDWFLAGIEEEIKLSTFIDSAISAIYLAVDDARFNCWMKLITSLFMQYQQGKIQPICDKMLQYVFVKLALFGDYEAGTDGDNNMYKVLSGVLEHTDIIKMKVADIKGLFIDVSTTYNLEEIISELILKITENSSVNIVNEYRSSLVEGWSIHNDECEVCGKKLWGVGLSPIVFKIWEHKRRKEEIPDVVIENAKLVIFKCNHGFHTKCLENLGQKNGNYECLLCNEQ
ncbi:hypothetical protein KAFR_0A06530 [Kazachstania africana CBS 2517]|uniref:RING-type domain-containing protein n=1 Tax=Kazachstania africana (strain ATCC 22294 / BCRC 22015 / CBS 2517 / CECT 1963 / NBRC 1671 / NRRL Y-8276) TaxID=1071382 RepID=H2ANY8_KAZAF|nr:hypothetical protein KAFR_0A06530 [Kazachstania africana CBS 2517]CCF56088.1 hypothetical protein KAFR_0A06530 [Kazachstania africana CBS 2517]